MGQQPENTRHVLLRVLEIKEQDWVMQMIGRGGSSVFRLPGPERASVNTYFIYFAYIGSLIHGVVHLTPPCPLTLSY